MSEGPVGAIGPLRFSFVRGGPFFEAQRALGLMPNGTLGVVRRIAVAIAITWLPIMTLAFVNGHLYGDGTSEPLLRHFGIHARFLLAVPAFIVAEAVLDGLTFALIPHFETSGLVDDTLRPPFRDALRSVERLRDSRFAAAVIVGILVVNLFRGWHDALHLDETSWAMLGGPATSGLTFAGWWYLGVSRPIFALALFLWFWRIFLVGTACRRIAQLDLRLVPTHPDRAGGLGFLELLPLAFTPVAFGASAVLASRWAHDVVYHGVHVQALQMPIGIFLLIALVLFLSPLAPFSGMLRRLKRRARLQYGSLFAHHGRLVHRRWILRQEVGEQPLLSAPEIGPVADVISAYESIEAIRPTPLKRAPLVALAAALALPLIAMAAIEVPVGQLLMTLGKALM